VDNRERQKHVLKLRQSSLFSMHPQATIMKKLTLKFTSFPELSAFMKQMTGGYFINTNTLTITANFQSYQIEDATSQYGALLIETNDKVYSYDPL
jgi:hypothetical protein